jgi:CheY-like chemotaxis protein
VTAQRGFESIERNVRLQAQLTADVLDISKALTGKLRIDSRPVSLRAVVQEALASVSAAGDAKGLRINLTAPEVPVVVRGDADRLRQVVGHLLANAIKFTPRDGAVQVSVDANDVASITVRDNGPGIDPDFLPRIFDRFTQADASPTRSAGGLGVGLSLVREIVERHAGEIHARNDAGDRGAVFTIKLPLHPDDQRIHPPLRMPASTAVGSPPLTGVRVLVLDRDRDGRELMAVVLEQRGAAVRLVESIDQALEVLEAWRPDVLVSDALSPDHDSYSLIGKVHSLESDRGGRIPALALTTVSRTNQEMWRLLSDVHCDLPKPVEPAILTAEIARLTGRERRRAQR